jgi:DNA-binding transcriptional LysR family regulator
MYMNVNGYDTPMQLPPLECLRCFSAAARLLNFRAAARSVALTPAALGQRIKQLEDIVGRSLFSRTSRKVVPTEAGLALVPVARAALDAAERCLAVARGDLAPQAQEIFLGTRHELGMSWVLPALPVLRARHPGTTFHVYFGSGGDLLARIRTLDVHCAIGSMRLGDPLIAAVPLHPERYVLTASPTLLRKLPFRNAGDARRHTLIDIDLGLPLFGYLRDAPGGAKFRFARHLAIGAGSAAKELVLHGEGVAVLPEYLIRRELAARRLVRLLPRQPVQQDWFRLFFRADDPRRAFYESLAASLRGQPLR